MAPRSRACRRTRRARSSRGLPLRLLLVGLDGMQIVAALQAIDVQDPGEMFGLMDHALRAELLALDGETLAGDIGRDEPRRDRTLEHPVQTAHGEATFRGLLDLIALPLELRFDGDDAGVV